MNQAWFTTSYNFLSECLFFRVEINKGRAVYYKQVFYPPC